MCELKFKVTQMTVKTDSWFYCLNHVHESLGEDKWTISRWNVRDAKIPPLGMVWTKCGWRHMFNRDSELEYLSEAQLRTGNILI